MANTFSQWLLEEMGIRGMTNTDVAKAGGISHARVSQVVSGDNPGRRFCAAVARAFKVPPEDVFRRAGLLPPAPENTDSIAELVYKFTQLSDEGQEMALEFVATLLEREERRRGTEAP